MSRRFDLTPLFRGHYKALTRADRGPGVPDVTARLALLVPAAGLGLVAWKWSWELQAPAAILTATALLAGGALTSFTHMSTLRQRWTDQLDDESLDRRREALDESVAHLLLAALLCIVDALLLIVGMNVAPAAQSGEPSTVGLPFAPLIIAVTTYLGLLFILVIPRLYAAYVDANDVPRYLSGFHRSLRR